MAEDLLPDLELENEESRPLLRYNEMQSAARFPLQLPVQFRCADGAHQGETRNISANGVLLQVDADLPLGSNGVLLQVDADLPLGSVVEFSIDMPSQVLGAAADVAVNCRGRVVRCFDDQDHRWVGVVIDQYGFERR